MWPTVLEMSRDECRRTLRRLELEAYSSMVSVFRAQGALQDDRKKLLEELRGALHISGDRHTAEARRASNDELLGTIALQLSGPNTELGWMCEGRRKVPILPRSVPQTMYTELADHAAEIASKENQKIALKRLADEETEKLKSHGDNENIEGGVQDMEVDETCSPPQIKIENSYHPPIVTYDNSDQLASEEVPPRKKCRQDIPLMSSVSSPTASTPPHAKPNHQRYIDISGIYSSYIKTPTSGKVKQEKQQNQSGKTPHGPKSAIKHKNIHAKHGGRNSGRVAIPHHQVRTGIKSPTDPHMPGAQAMNIQATIDMNQLKSQTSGFQANFAQSIARRMNLDDSTFDLKHASIAQNQQIMDSPTMQLLTQSNVQQDNLPLIHGDGGTLTDIATPLVPSPTIGTDLHHSSPVKQHAAPTTGKSCQFIIKKHKVESVNDNSVKASPKVQVTNVQVLPPKSDVGGVKVLQNRHIVMASPNNTLPKVVNSGGKIVTAKFVQQLPPKSQSQLNLNAPKTNPSNLSADKVIIVSKPVSPTVQTNFLQKTLSRPKNIIISNQGAPIKEPDTNKSIEMDFQTKSQAQITDSKVQPKTFLVNPKSGQRMVVLPAKARSKGSLVGQSVPVMQMKGFPGKQTPVKLVPLGSQSNSNDTKTNNITIVSKPNSNILTKVISKESYAHINPPALDTGKSAHVQIAPKPKGQAIIRQTGPNTKGNLIVLQKSSTPNRSPITLSKSNSDLPSKIVMSDKANTMNIAQRNALTDSEGISKNTGNVIVLQMTSDQADHPDNIPEFMHTDTNKEREVLKVDHAIITEDTPVLFHNQVTNPSANPQQTHSAADTLMDTIKSSALGHIESVKQNDGTSGKDTTVKSNVSSKWDIGTTSNRDKSEKMTLDLEMMSSESEIEAYADSSQDGPKKEAEEAKENDIQSNLNADESNDMLREQHSSITNISRTLLSQLQDEGSSSNDSSFLFSKSIAKANSVQSDVQKQSPSLQPANISADQTKVNQGKTTIIAQEQTKLDSRQNRMDIFSTAIASADINLESFEYLEDDMISQDEILELSNSNQGQSRDTEVLRQHKDKEQTSLERELHHLMEEDHLVETMESSCPPSGAIE